MDLKLFIPITKLDVERRLVYGVATAEQVDSAGEVCDYASTKPLYQAWSEKAAEVTGGKSLGNLRAMHQPVAAGKLTGIDFDDDSQEISVVAKVVDDAEWDKCLEGVYTGFSQGGRYVARWTGDDGKTHYTADPVEISLVDLPCLPSATFDLIRGGGLVEKRHFTSTAAPQEGPVNPTNDQVVAKAHELAKAAGDENQWSAHIEAARAALTKAAEAPPAPAATVAPVAVPAAPVAAQTAAEAAAEPVTKTEEAPVAGVVEKTAEAEAAPELEQVWKTADGQTFKTKGLARAHVAALKDAGPTAALEGAMARAQAAIDGAPAAKAAAPAIADAAALTKAVEAHAALTTLANQVSRRSIRKAAVALGALESLPATIFEKGARPEGDGFAKTASLWSLSGLLSLLDSLECAEEDLEYESMWPDSVNVSDDLKTRFGTLVVELADICAAILDAIISAMKAEEAGEALARGALATTLIKAGARHSKGDKALLKTAHDTLVKLGAECGDDMGKLAKGAEPDAALAKRTADLEKANAALTDSIGKATELLTRATEALEKRDADLADVTERLKKIEAQPMQGGPARLSIMPENVNTALEEATKAAQGGDLMAASRALIKAAQQAPRSALDGHLTAPPPAARITPDISGIAAKTVEPAPAAAAAAA